MGKRVFVSADWKEDESNKRSCDKTVVDRIRKWRDDDRYIVELQCTDEVHDSVLKNSDCRRCEIKEECGKQIQWSSVVVVVIGDNTATKKSGACDSISCSPAYSGLSKKGCKYEDGDIEIDEIALSRKMSYLQYEVSVAYNHGKPVVLVFNSTRCETSWIPDWYTRLGVKEVCRVPFWKNADHTKDCYQDIKEYLQ